MMERSETLLFTGLTGSLGSALGVEALRRGWRILALGRDATPSRALERIHAALSLHGWRQENGGVDVVKGDLGLPSLGVPRRYAWPGISCIVNCAGSTEFRAGAAERNRLVNVEGVRHLLELATRLRTRFVHVSTAYVAGRRADVVREVEIDVGQEFHNSYEQTKCEAELLIEEWRRRTGIPVTVLRPSIVVGHSVTGRTVRFMTLYDLMQAFDVIASRLGQVEVRVAADSRATKNLIPVDYFARVAWHLIASHATGTYHVTHPEPPTVGEMRDIFCRLFAMDGISIVDAEEFEARPPTPAERLYQKANSVYDPYLRAEPRFDRSRTDEALAGSDITAAPLDAAFFSRLLAYARECGWGRSPRTAPTARGAVVDLYFQNFLRGKLHQQLLPNLRRLTATFRVVVKDLPEACWALAIREGKLESVSRDARNAQCLFTVDLSTFLEVVSGRLTPQEAFFQRRIDIDGEVDTGLHLAAVLAEFFQEFPFDARPCGTGAR